MDKLFLTWLTLLSGLTWAELDLQKFCEDKSLNEIIAHPLDCRGYITCGEQPAAEYCAQGFHFDIRSLVCNWPENVNCQISPRQIEEAKNYVKPTLTSLAAYDIMTGQVIGPMVGYNPLNVACRHFGAYFLPNPHKCRSYYLCAYGHMHEHTCGPHTLWDYKLQQCVLSHQADCYQFSREEEKELSLALHNIMMVCYPIKANSSSSERIQLTTTDYVTSLTTTPTMTTPPPTPPVITVMPTTTMKPMFSNPYNITCPVKRQTYLAHPEDCSKYFMCIMGTAVMTYCPKGLLWNAKMSYCDISKNVKCFQEKIIKEKVII